MVDISKHEVDKSYPAGHVWIYTVLYKVTSQGRDIFGAQIFFMQLYLATLAITLYLYRTTKIPPYILPLLCLSKRLHSIYILRMFNDCWAQFFMLGACWFFVKRQWTLGGLAYSFALGVKMNALLYLPGILVVIVMAQGLERAFRTIILILEVQVSKTNIGRELRLGPFGCAIYYATWVELFI